VNNFKIIIISNPTPIINEASIITDLFNNGLELFHIRKPSNTISETEKLLKNIPKDFHSKIVIHQHYQLTNHYNLKGIHIKSINKNNNEIIANDYNIISTSFHSFNELSNKNTYQYVFLSPLFNSISKKGYNSQFKIEELKSAYSEGIIDSKVIALGGINLNNIGLIKELGFGGVAVLGYIWEK
jgi:thiamine-phosphate pyrophosphorylase